MSVPGKIISAVYRKYSHYRIDLNALSGISRRFYQNARGACMVIYHGICLEDPLRFNRIFLQLKTFEAHLQYFRQYFHIVSLDDYYRGNFRNDRFNICLTFDDGYANNFHYVLPLLEKYQAPAAFFITAIRDAGFDILWNDFLGILQKQGPALMEYNGEQFRKQRGRYYSLNSHQSLAARLQAVGFPAKAEMMQALYPLAPFRENGVSPDYWLQMTAEQITAMAASSFVTIGCHGYYHNDLAKISARDAADEMARSRKYLEQLAGKPVNAIAFPYGSYSPAVVAEAKAAGFEQLLAMDFVSPGDHADPFMRERFTINPLISVHNQLYAIIHGKYA